MGWTPQSDPALCGSGRIGPAPSRVRPAPRDGMRRVKLKEIGGIHLQDLKVKVLKIGENRTAGVIYSRLNRSARLESLLF